jgi:hypothetical protein
MKMGDKAKSTHDLKGKVDFAVITVRIDEFEAVLRVLSPTSTVGGNAVKHFFRDIYGNRKQTVFIVASQRLSNFKTLEIHW